MRAEVYVKYLDPNSSNWTAAMNSLITSIASGTAPANTFIDGGSPGSTGGVTAPHLGALNKSGETGTAPKAYLNYIIFDRDYIIKDGGFVRVTTAAREYGQDGALEKLSASITVSEPGYIYLYLSNDNVSLGGGQVEVYFDDFKVEYVKSPVVQSQDYYPFGLTYNSYQRENSLSSQWKFQGQENVDELGLGWDSFKWRNHQPEIGRFFGVDPLAEKYLYNSVYAFSENKVVSHRELEGLEAESVNSPTVSNINVTPIWKNGDLQGHNVTFTFTQQQSSVQYDQNNVAIATVNTTSTSVHTLQLTRSGAPTWLPANTPKIDKQNGTFIKELPVKGAQATIVKTVTPISTNSEPSKQPTSTTSFQNTGAIKLSAGQTAGIKYSVRKLGASLLSMYGHFITGRDSKDKPVNRLKYRQDVIHR